MSSKYINQRNLRQVAFWLLYSHAMSSVSISLLAVVVATIAGFIISSIWYSDSVFGASWQRATGASHKPLHASWKQYLSSIISNLILAYILAHFVQFALIAMNLPGEIVDGAIVGAWAWLGFVATTGFVNIYHKKQSIELWVIETGQHLVSFVIMAILVTTL